MTNRQDISAAAQRIAPHIRRTPVMDVERGLWGLRHPITLKLELLQVAGSFKPRGAFNRILSNPVPASGVIAASGGNHGIATAYAARKLGHIAEIFVPVISSSVKQQRLRDLGARLTVTGENYFAALAAQETRAALTGALTVHAYNMPETIAGQGTCGMEFDAQAPGLDTVLVACGGGGLIAGIASWFAGRARVISVEPERSQCLAAAFRAGAPVNVPVAGIAADSLGATCIGALTWAICKRYVERAITVTDDAIAAAQKVLWRDLQLVAEPGGATALAALLSGAYLPLPTERVGVLLCGSNADVTKLTSV